MSRLSGLLGLPEFALNSLSLSIAAIGIGIAFRIGVSPHLALKWANNQLITSTTANKLESVVQQVDQNVEIIEQKDEAYEQLEETYNGWLTHEVGGNELNKAFNAIKDLPEVEDTEEIQAEIEEIEEELSEVTIE